MKSLWIAILGFLLLGLALSAQAQNFSTALTCPVLTRSLYLGRSGSDVLALQKFLSKQYPGFLPRYWTGYFGKLTEAYLKIWQLSNKVVPIGPYKPGWGIAGPKTKIAILASCQSAYNNVPPSYSPSPVSIPPAPASCVFNGQPLASGASITAYQYSNVPYGQICNSEIRTCYNGTLSGSFQYNYCSQSTSLLSCAFNSSDIPNGSSVTAYQSSNVPYGQTCSSESRTCSNGVLSGSYPYSSCSAGSALPCSWNGSSVPNSSSVTAYQANSVPFGETCTSETRACSNGNLSGSYQYASCSAQATSSVELTLVAQSQTSLATFQSHDQKVVSTPYGIFMTFLASDPSSANPPYSPGTWMLMRSTDGGQTFSSVYKDSTHATAVPALEAGPPGHLLLSFADWITNKSYVLDFDMASGLSSLNQLTSEPAEPMSKFASVYDPSSQNLFFSLIQSYHFVIFNTLSKSLNDQLLFAAGPNAYPQYPYMAEDSGILYLGWTTTPEVQPPYSGPFYYSNHFIVSRDGGASWQTPDGKPISIPLISDDTGPGVLITIPSDIGQRNFMENMLPWRGKVHFTYSTYDEATAGLIGERYVRYSMGPTYGVDKTMLNLQGDTLKIGGWGSFFTGDQQTGDLYVTGREMKGSQRGASERIVTLVSHDNGDTWHDFAVSAPFPNGTTIYSVGGSRYVTPDGYIIGSFTTDPDQKVYFFKVKVR